MQGAAIAGHAMSRINPRNTKQTRRFTLFRRRISSATLALATFSIHPDKRATSAVLRRSINGPSALLCLTISPNSNSAGEARPSRSEFAANCAATCRIDKSASARGPRARRQRSRYICASFATRNVSSMPRRVRGTREQECRRIRLLFKFTVALNIRGNSAVFCPAW